ncbi:hypothetical protein [Occallatibacter riparius]|uniref:Antitoxin n=1 Tax=Occallatibacter riparius TaxID=1002689 RepID=A0A9J7BVK4_9BACT|nr:hypothetical protein [Occallatibacter riparius]UWZ86569.1 hypothetical protein MOP44_11630 [Occallatibacter riparius]
MRTTIDIPDETYRELKVKAAREGKTFREIALRAIKRELEIVGGEPAEKFEIPVIRSRNPGTLDLTNEQIDELTAFT